MFNVFLHINHNCKTNIFLIETYFENYFQYCDIDTLCFISRAYCVHTSIAHNASDRFSK